MKKIKLLCFIFLCLFFCDTKVFAFDEYDLTISTAGSVTVQNASNHSTVSDYSSILKYENNVLTIYEDVHLNYVRLSKTMTITSNDKKVYINIIYSTISGSTYTLKDLNLESYMTADKKEHFKGSSSTIYSAIQTSGKLVIDSSNIILTACHDETADDSVAYIYAEKGVIEIKDSNITLDGQLISYTNDSIISNSNIELTDTAKQGYIYFSANVTMTDSNIDSYGQVAISKTANITDSTITTNNEIRGYVTLGNSNIENSTINSKSFFITENAYFKDSTIYSHNYKVTSEDDETNIYFKTRTAFCILGDLTIDNSKIILDTTNDLPVMFIKGTVDFGEEYGCFIDKDNNVLELTKVTVSEDNFYKGYEDTPTYTSGGVEKHYFGNDGIVTLGEEVYMVTLNGEYSLSAENSTYTPFTLKIKNGTWNDNTTTDITIKVPDGKTVSNYFPKELTASEGYEKGTWKKTGENEYTYIFTEKTKEVIENPKTGVSNILGLFFVSCIMLVMIILVYNKFTAFKKI